MIVLSGPGQHAAVDPHGAALRSWVAGGAERLSTVDPADRGHAHDGVALMPWPNRIRDGRYAFGGAEHALPVTEPARGAALHGLVADVEWTVCAQAPNAVRLRRRVGPVAGFPFTLDAEAGFRLDGRGLTAELTAVNAGDADAPFGAGAHPYLRGPVDGMALALDAGTAIPVDEDRRLPTGGPASVTPPRALDGVRLDTCFGDLARDADGVARVRAGAVTVWLDRAFAFVHIYTGDDEPDPRLRRTRLAVEPVTCAPDAFNTGVGLRTLAPGRRFRGRWGLTLEHP